MSASTPSPAAEGAVKRLARLPGNTICPNCGTQKQFGFGTVCIKYLTFVCNHCKSAHQAVSHRCKSLTMSSWTEGEVLQLKTVGGNDIARQTWLGNAPPPGVGGRPREGDSVDLFKTFVVEVYEHKKYYLPGGNADANTSNAPTSQSTADITTTRRRGAAAPPTTMGPPQAWSQQEPAPVHVSAAAPPAPTIDFLSFDGPDATSTSNAIAPTPGGSSTLFQPDLFATTTSMSATGNATWEDEPFALSTTSATHAIAPTSAFDFIQSHNLANMSATAPTSQAAPVVSSSSAFDFMASHLPQQQQQQQSSFSVTTTTNTSFDLIPPTPPMLFDPFAGTSAPYHHPSNGSTSNIPTPSAPTNSKKPIMNVPPTMPIMNSSSPPVLNMINMSMPPTNCSNNNTSNKMMNTMTMGGENMSQTPSLGMMNPNMAMMTSLGMPMNSNTMSLPAMGMNPAFGSNNNNNNNIMLTMQQQQQPWGMNNNGNHMTTHWQQQQRQQQQQQQPIMRNLMAQSAGMTNSNAISSHFGTRQDRTQQQQNQHQKQSNDPFANLMR